MGPMGWVGGAVSFWRKEETLVSVGELRVMCLVMGARGVAEAILGF